MANDDSASQCSVGAGGKDVFFRFTLTDPTDVSIDTEGSTFDTVLSLWSECSVAGVTGEIDCNDDFAGLASRLDFLQLAAGTYFIQLDGSSIDDSGEYVLNLSSPVVPLHDDCANASPMTVDTTVRGSTLGATDSPGLPIPGHPTEGPDVFYRFQATSPNMRVDTLNSDLDTVLAVRGGGCSGAVVGANDDFGGTNQSQLELTSLTVGNEYIIQVDAAAGNAGTFRLTLSEMEAPPTNDTCSEAMVALSVPTEVTGTTQFATDSSAPSVGNGDGPDVAFKITVQQGDSLVLDALGSAFDPTLYLRAGSCNGPEILPSDDLFGRKPPRLTYSGLNAGDYFIFLDGETVADRGDFTLNITAGEAPPNDDCASALLVGIPSTQVGSTQFATDTTNSDPSCGSNDNDVVFRFVLEEPTRLRIDTLGSQFDTVLYLRTGECTGETELACNDDSESLGGTISRIEDFEVTPLPAGEYRVYVDGIDDAGPFVLNLIGIDLPEIEGDFNGDQLVNAKDLIFLVEKSAEDSVPPVPPDFNGDGQVTHHDLWAFETLWYSHQTP